MKNGVTSTQSTALAVRERLASYGPLVDAQMRRMTAPRGEAAGIYGMVQYHMGWRDSALRAADTPTSGKGLRSRFCLLCADVCGGDLEAVVPVAAAIDLFHNFSLIHDDIEDNSATRHHRPTAWTIWGVPQTINTGDALFALAQRSLLASSLAVTDPARLLLIAQEAQETMILLAEGQFLDISFEQSATVGIADYLAMIERKSAVLIAFAVWAGATAAGMPPATCTALRQFGREVGLAFQVRDDVLGIWGDEALTGKSGSSDILSRKKSLPIVLAFEILTGNDVHTLRRLYAAPSLAESDVPTVLAILARGGIRAQVEARVREHDSLAQQALQAANLPPAAYAMLSACSQLFMQRSA